MGDYILEMEGISKDFFGVYALKDVNFKVKRGEIHALCGENGAGKSTLMKVLSGVYKYGDYSGVIRINGEECRFQNVRDAEKAGVAIIYQELSLVGEMDIGENIFLNAWPKKHGVIDASSMYFDTDKLCKELNIQANPKTKTKNLGVGVQQLVEIARSLTKNADILVLDEPSASLTEKEVETLMSILRKLKEKGVTCIYISHKLGEILEIADSVTVIRDGNVVGTYKTAEIDEPFVIKAMVGREMTDRYPYARRSYNEEVVMEVRHYNLFDTHGRQVLKDINFKVHTGEILGISGLMGAGRTELALSLFGAFEGKTTGELYIDGKRTVIKSPSDAIEHKLAMVSEDRKKYGLFLQQSVSQNIVASSMKKLARLGVIDDSKQHHFANSYAKELKIKVPSLQSAVNNLSGGNQQKVVVAKWLMTEPKILFLDEPTRGIDVGAKYEIYTLMMELVEKGYSIVMISSELPEILGMSDRILVMHEGQITGELTRDEADQERIMMYATGGAV